MILMYCGQYGVLVTFLYNEIQYLTQQIKGEEIYFWLTFLAHGLLTPR